MFFDFLAFEGIEHAHSTIYCTVEDGLWPALIEMACLNCGDHFPHIADDHRIQLVAISKLVVFALSARLELCLNFYIIESVTFAEFADEEIAKFIPSCNDSIATVKDVRSRYESRQNIFSNIVKRFLDRVQSVYRKRIKDLGCDDLLALHSNTVQVRCQTWTYGPHQKLR